VKKRELYLTISISSGRQPFEGAASTTIHFDTGVSRSRESSSLELSDDSFRTGFIQIRLKRLVVVPAADFHDDAGIHPLLDQAGVREVPAKIVRRDLLKVVVARPVGSLLGDGLHDALDRAARQVDIGVLVANVLGALVAVQVALNAARKVRIAGLATVAGRVFAFGDAQEVVGVVLDDLPAWMRGRDLWYFERAQADLTAEADDKLVAVGGGCPAEGLVLVRGEPTLLELAVGGTFDSHYRVGVL
jgi:hypothetical protein